MGALEARPQDVPQGQRRALSTWPRLARVPKMRPRDAGVRPLYAG